MNKKPYWILGAVAALAVVAGCTGHFSGRGAAIFTACVSAVLGGIAFAIDGRDSGQ